MKDAILEIQNLRVSFREEPTGRSIEAVRGLSLEVAKNSFTALVGESGSGKSVTALSVTGLLSSSSRSGRILYHAKDGRKVDLASLSESELAGFRGREIAYIFQDPSSSLNPVVKAGKQLRAPRREVLDLFKQVHLKDAERVYESYPHELSGGMKQRVLIAMALLLEPALLIADEPTSALDVTTEYEIMRLLVEIQKERALSILFITHDLNLASAYADTLCVLSKGQVVERLLRRDGFKAQKDYTRRLFRANLRKAEPKVPLEI